MSSFPLTSKFLLSKGMCSPPPEKGIHHVSALLFKVYDGPHRCSLVPKVTDAWNHVFLPSESQKPHTKIHVYVHLFIETAGITSRLKTDVEELCIFQMQRLFLWVELGICFPGIKFAWQEFYVCSSP
jgi:hypothetical protein